MTAVTFLCGVAIGLAAGVILCWATQDADRAEVRR